MKYHIARSMEAEGKGRCKEEKIQNPYTVTAREIEFIRGNAGGTSSAKITNLGNVHIFRFPFIYCVLQYAMMKDARLVSSLSSSMQSSGFCSSATR